MKKIIPILLLIFASYVYGADITLDSSTTYQTWQAWSTHFGGDLQAGPGYGLAWPSSSVPSWASTIYSESVNDLGITGLVFTVNSSMQNTTAYFSNYVSTCATYGYNSSQCTTAYATYHSNMAAIVSSPVEYHFDVMDRAVNNFVNPMRTLVLASGQTPSIIIQTEDHWGFSANGSPAYYSFSFDHTALSNFWKATLDHYQSAFGYVPDLIDILGEPDYAGGGFPLTSSLASCSTDGDCTAPEHCLGTPDNSNKCQKLGYVMNNNTTAATMIGNAIVTVMDNLTGTYPNIKIMSPTVYSLTNAPNYVPDIFSVSGASSYIGLISFHDYGSSCNDYACCSNEPAMAGYTTTYSIPSGMTEEIAHEAPSPGVYSVLHNNLKCANISRWDGMYTIMGSTDWGANDGSFFKVTNESTPTVTLTNSAKVVRQYSKYIRPGAVRISATGSSTYDPVAFKTSYNGGTTVVVKLTSSATSFTVAGLPAGTYSVKYTSSDASTYDSDLGDVASSGSGDVPLTNVPSGATGALTIFLKNALNGSVFNDSLEFSGKGVYSHRLGGAGVTVSAQ